MSQTLSLVAMESKVSLWIGQKSSSGATLYRDNTTNKKLHRFLKTFSGEVIELVNDNLLDEFPEYTNIKEFEEEND